MGAVDAVGKLTIAQRAGSAPELTGKASSCRHCRVRTVSSKRRAVWRGPHGPSKLPWRAIVVN
jgi:hypothetical protein